MANLDENILLDELYKDSPWIDMSGVDWSCVTSGLKPKLYKKNEVIYHQQDYLDYVFLVKEGRIRCSVYSPNGEEKSIFIGEAGSLLGELSPIDGLPNMGCSTAAADSWLYLIPKTRFSQELSANHEFSLNLLRLMTKKMRLLVTEIKQLSFNDSYYRVCYALIHLIRQYAVKTESGYRLNIKFTHQEMGNLTGLSRVSVSNILSNMAYDNIIQKEDGFLLINDIDGIFAYLQDNI